MSKKSTPTPPERRVLAIDPGYDRCGVAIIDRVRGKDTLLYSACITTDKRSSFADRLVVIGEKMVDLVTEHEPDALSIEHLYFTNNQKTAMRVAEVRGMIIYIVAAHQVPIFEYTPPQVKVAVAGWGGADKKQLQLIVPKLIKVEKIIKYDDEFDAIALGITHLASFRG